MKNRTLQQSRRTQAQMHALAAVRKEIGSQDPVGNSKYLREFNDAFRKYDATLSPEQLDERISQATILLVGDYHALASSQHFATDLLERCAQKNPVVLGLEAVLARDQNILNAWWRREISGENLRERLRFDREWGYPWEPFHELLRSARDHAEGVYGLDCVPRDDLRRIRSRDRHAAAKIRELRQRHSKSKIVVLFGESHMAPQHLPQAVRELMPEERLLLALQNLDALYWQATNEHSPALREGAVAVREDAVCVFNSSPIEKYEAYRICLERWKAANEEPQDFAPAVYNLIFSLAKSLGFRLDSPSNGTQPKFLADSLPEIVNVSSNSDRVDGMRNDESCVYHSESNSLFIRHFHIGEVAEQCTRFLHHACRAMTNAVVAGQPIEHALARFGSRLLSPESSPQEATPALGDSVYAAYLSGNISRPAIRRLFLSHLETREQAEAVLETLTTIAKSH